ncbi:hypothetical protein [Streptomyces lancefieldiae]|uniref:Uncharacterized protein n=1 Tax=Streptomyces lancefieldiae TaxID=3075520 RepID=A0ABU3AF58_9ACTN|nr:hypothetical protein [Streptomyces sp. DSM 40712]MDT0608812.1 hypothetical protein [Streptomyces sp. DSM 40712]
MTDHRALVARLEVERARALASARHATAVETRLVADGIASGFLHAAALVVREFEVAEAAQAYAQRAVDGEAGEAPSAV